MKLNLCTLLLLSSVASFVIAEENIQAASVFVQDPALFLRQQKELQKLQSNLSSPNEQLEALLVDADKIAKMNDRCATISLNDVMDEDCVTFYKVDLPAFEENFMKVTGEVRLGYTETVRGLDDRKIQIDACADALLSFVNSKDESLNFLGEVFLEPLVKGFEANYDFTLQYEPKQHSKAIEIAQKWGEACKDIVTRQNESSFAPYFQERLNDLNKSLEETGSMAVIKLDITDAPTVYLDLSKPVRGAYYLNGIKLFHSRIAPSTAANSNLRITFSKEGVIADGEKFIAQKNGRPVQYKGKVLFEEKVPQIHGRIFWDNQDHNENIDFGPDYDEDSLAIVKAEKAKEEQAIAEKIIAEKNAENLKRQGLHFSFWAGITGDRISYTHKSVCDYLNLVNDVNPTKNTCNNIDEGEDYASRSYTFYMPDIGAAARVKYNFGPSADLFATAGVGGMFGLAYGEKKNYRGQFKRSYGGLLGQLELGYKSFGIRETMIFHINIDNGPSWNQFRLGGFYGFDLSKIDLNVELGYTIITNAGSGFYASVGTTF